MIVFGLTGSIGMGKSTATRMMEDMGGVSHSADEAVHQAMAKGGPAYEDIANEFFKAVRADGEIDRVSLGALVFNNPERRKRLEQMLHPYVRESEWNFIKKALDEGRQFVILDIPLLFETGADARVDYTIVVTAPFWVQRRRVLARPNMSLEKFNNIKAVQMSDSEKRRRADFVVQTGYGDRLTRFQLRRILNNVLKENNQSTFEMKRG